MDKSRTITFKIGQRHKDALAAKDNNATAAIRTLCLEWSAEWFPPLPDDDSMRVGRRGGVRLMSLTKRLDDGTIAALRMAGDGNLSAGVRRLALWGMTQ